MAELLNQSQFAKRIGQSRQHVGKLKEAGRLVMVGDKVDAEASIALIAQTAGNRDDVRDRHAQARAASAGEVPAPVIDSMEKARRVKAVSEARRVAALADKEEMERDRLAGDLIAREDVDAAMKFIGATVRGLLDVFPDQTAPVIAHVTSMDECHAMLTEACRNVLVGLGDAIEKQRAALDGSNA